MMNPEGELSLPEVEAALAQGPTGQPNTSSEPPLSPDEYLLQALEAHLNAERASLAQYRALAESTQDPIVALIMGIVLEDEERHHTLLRRLAARLNDDLSWVQSWDALPASTAAGRTQRPTQRCVRSWPASGPVSTSWRTSLAERTGSITGWRLSCWR